MLSRSKPKLNLHIQNCFPVSSIRKVKQMMDRKMFNMMSTQNRLYCVSVRWARVSVQHEPCLLQLFTFNSLFRCSCYDSYDKCLFERVMHDANTDSKWQKKYQKFFFCDAQLNCTNTKESVSYYSPKIKSVRWSTKIFSDKL